MIEIRFNCNHRLLLQQMKKTTVLFLWIVLFLSHNDIYPQSSGEDKWWKETTIYQIYPRSYKDSDGDGIGDLQGIISKLDYIKNLGFETIWISPFYQSPQGDFGYDISNYRHADNDYGTDADIDLLIQAVHKRGMKIVFDLVLNHTSIEHQWFKESRSSKTGPKSDWYVWQDGNGKKPPNNWINVFNKEAWHYEPKRQQWFYTAFLNFQPDLNWRNPEVKEAMFNVVRYWLKKDVDGFRLDIFNCIVEEENFTDNPFVFKLLPSRDGMKGNYQEKINNINHPDNTQIAVELRSVLDEYSSPDRFLIGEAIGPLSAIKPLLGPKNNGLNLVFLFDMIYFDFKASFFRNMIVEFEQHFPSPLMPTIVFGNHDNFRSMKRIQNDLDKGRLLALFQFTARGVPVVYYGEEIGMQNKYIKKQEALDPISDEFKGIPEFMRNWLPVPINRDACRTPMQWKDSINGSFTGSNTKPWLPSGPDLENRNVETQTNQERSMLNTYTALLHLRNESLALKKGTITLLNETALPRNVLAYTRQFENEHLLVIMNFSGKEKSLDLSSSNYTKVYGLNTTDVLNDTEIQISPFGGMVLRVD